MRNGCLIDFLSLLECWDEHQKDKQDQVKKDLNLKKASIRITDRVKSFTTHDTVLAEINDLNDEEKNI